MASDGLVLKRDSSGKAIGIDFEASARAFAETKSCKSIQTGGGENDGPTRFVVFVRPGQKDVKIDLEAVRDMDDVQIDGFLSRRPSFSRSPRPSSLYAS